MKNSVLFLIVFLFACGIKPPPSPDPCQPIPDEVATIVWKSNVEAELSWVDMPVTVGGGDEACVLERQATFDLGETRHIRSAYSFHGFDNGDVVESLTVLYARDGTSLYRRSEHLESVGAEYDAYDPPQSVDRETDFLTLDAVCRVTGNNRVTGDLSARCHFIVVLEFKDGAPPLPPTSCDVPHSEDLGWVYVATSARSPKLKPGDPKREFLTRSTFAAAKAAVDPRGQPWIETLSLLAGWVNAHGGCAAGPWDDELVILADDGVYEGYKAVATAGQYQGQPERDAWRHSGSVTTCGSPTPPPLDNWAGPSEHNRWYQATPRITSREYCANWWTDGRRRCPPRPEGHPEREVCEALIVGGEPLWRSDGKLILNDNPFLARCCQPGDAGAKCLGAPPCSFLEVCHSQGHTCSRTVIQ